jgi:hypothetical protein
MRERYTAQGKYQALKLFMKYVTFKQDQFRAVYIDHLHRPTLVCWCFSMVVVGSLVT